MEKYIDFKNGIKYDKLKEIAENINNGGIVIFPTETVYGIGVNPFNIRAVEKVYEIKKRPKEKPISLLISDLSMLYEISDNISNEELKVIKKFFPGPLTIILKKSKILDVILINSFLLFSP